MERFVFERSIRYTDTGTEATARHYFDSLEDATVSVAHEIMDVWETEYPNVKLSKGDGLSFDMHVLEIIATIEEDNEPYEIRIDIPAPRRELVLKLYKEMMS